MKVMRRIIGNKMGLTVVAVALADLGSALGGRREADRAYTRMVVLKSSFRLDQEHEVRYKVHKTAFLTAFSLSNDYVSRNMQVPTYLLPTTSEEG
jgi:hypothetical protein